MIFPRLFKRARRLWLVGIVLLMLAIAALRSTGSGLIGITSPTCRNLPEFRDSVPASVRAEIRYLFDNGLLYCERPDEPFRGLDGPIYWGAEGTTSVLFFQAESLRGVGVTTYGFGQPGELFNVTPPGDAPPQGYGELRTGEPAIRNEAEEEAPEYFVYHAGAPLLGDLMVTANARGPAAAREGVIGLRVVLRDVYRVWDAVRGRPPRGAGGTALSEVFFSIYPGRWVDLVRRDVNPVLAQGEEATIPAALKRAKEEGAVAGPTWYQTVSGELAGAVWAAGVLTETRPALILRDAGGAEIEPAEVALFDSSLTGLPLAMFGFPPQPVDEAFEAELWLDDAARQAGDPADLRFPVTFP